jgi:putative tricarboxylic transport membrane protein
MQESSQPSRIPQDLGAGLFLVAVALVALWQGAGLEAGTLREIGPGMLPKALAVLTGLCGIAIAVLPFVSHRGETLGAWSLRGSLFVLAAALAFAFSIRPLGFSVAGPVAIVLASLASRETRKVEIIIFALVMTVFCLILFRVLLGLPIPVAPWLLEY